MKSEKDLLYLAALLHDIGKFSQRADNDIAKTDESIYCPVYKGQYTHKHVLWTADFVNHYASKFKNFDIDGALIQLASEHHLSDSQLSDLGKFVKRADCLSSGMDRNSDNVLCDVQKEETKWDSFKRKRMLSLLQTISANVETETYHLPIEKMSLSRKYFPSEDFASPPDYKRLWSDFEQEFVQLEADTAYGFAETLLGLLQKYTSHIPASTIDFPDVSLYDHLKTTAAIAVCLYAHKESGEGGNAPFLLIGADFSGIQSYIYQIISTHASKNLKGRSFYLRLLSDVIVRYLLRELGLYSANVIYNSGGGFYILAPNTAEIKKKLQNAIKEIEERIFAEHGTALYVAIDSVELSTDVLMHKGDKQLGDVWAELFLKRDKKKNCRFSSMLKNNYNNFFEPQSVNTDKRDAITGDIFMQEEQPVKYEGLSMKSINKAQIEIGKKLKDTNLLVVKEGEPLPHWKECIHIAPLDLGFIYYFIAGSEIVEMEQLLKGSADNVYVVTFNGNCGDCNFLNNLKGANNIYQLDFYGGNEADTVKSTCFEELCENDIDEKGYRSDFERLGVLRMDVDNLGKIFQKGIKPERATLSRYSTLSRSFDYFFSGYLNTIWNLVAPEKSQIIYSGGDDVFIVARWDIAIEIAKRIREDFEEYTCGNKAFSLSGGIAIVEPKYPIMKAAELSASEETLAKSHICNGKSKNSISFMSMPLNWDIEFPFVEGLKEDIRKMLCNGELPKSFVSKIMIHFENACVENHKITNCKTYWMMAYDFERMKSRNKDANVNGLIDKCLKNIYNPHELEITTNYHPIELWALAARWAELEYRSNNNQ